MYSEGSKSAWIVKGVGGREKEAASAATGKLKKKKKKKYKPPDLTLHTIALDLENSNQRFE